MNRARFLSLVVVSGLLALVMAQAWTEATRPATGECGARRCGVHRTLRSVCVR